MRAKNHEKRPFGKKSRLKKEKIGWHNRIGNRTKKRWEKKVVSTWNAANDGQQHSHPYAVKRGGTGEKLSQGIRPSGKETHRTHSPGYFLRLLVWPSKAVTLMAHTE